MKKICIAIISIALIIAFGISLNNVEKTELQSTDGRDFEKATVTEIVSSDYSDSTSKDYDGSDKRNAAQLPARTFSGEVSAIAQRPN